MRADDMERLSGRRRDAGLPIEPPVRSTLATLVASVSQRSGVASDTPHYSADGSDDAKVEFEYAQANDFWQWFGGQASSADLVDCDVLDAGCGWGGKSLFYAETTGLRSMTGFDLEGWFDPAVPRRWAAARGLDNCTFAAAQAEDMPFDDESFDVVLMDDVLEHVGDPEQVLGECARVLRPGGRMYARFPSIKMIYAHHFDRITILPGLHRVIPMRTWVAGFNHWIISTDSPVVPFNEIERRFGREVSCDLSGMDLRDFSRIAMRSTLATRRLELEPIPTGTTRGLKRRIVAPVYHAARRVPPLTELLSFSISYIGEKPA